LSEVLTSGLGMARRFQSRPDDSLFHDDRRLHLQRLACGLDPSH
jgi:hypothetical protein